MSIVKISGYSVDIDIHAELEQYDWRRARWSADKLIACSPFRDDHSPSFYVNLAGDAPGTWGDSGSGDRGGFLRLLAHLRGEAEAETADYLLAEYGALYGARQDEPIRLPKIRLHTRQSAHGRPLSMTPAISPYLTKRGIIAHAQRLYGVGYDAEIPGYTALPWRAADGRIRNIKYRATTGKAFFYADGATPIIRLLYGLDAVAGAETIAVCEGEIDALSWATAGVAAVAVGGASISREQIDLLRRTSARTILLAGDNDEAGQRLNASVERALGGLVALERVDYGAQKDANDVLRTSGVDKLRNLARTPVQSICMRTIFEMGR